MQLHNKKFRFLALVLALATTLSPSALGAEEAASGIENFEDELEQLSQKIKSHLERTKEASFWSEKHTVQSPWATSETEEVQAPGPVEAGVNPEEELDKVLADEAADEEAAAVAEERSPEAAQEAVSTPAESAPAKVTEEAGMTTEEWIRGNEEEAAMRSRTQVTGRYRMAAGVGRNRTFSINDSNPDLQDRDYHYLFGERLNNTFDPAIYSQYQVDVESELSKNLLFYTQISADPWSYVGHTGEQTIKDSNVLSQGRVTYVHKYWGPNNSNIPQSLRASNRDILGIPENEIDSGHTEYIKTSGHHDFFSTYEFPEQDIDFEFRPIRKGWIDYKEDTWKFRFFPLADQNQAMTTDDPLGLSNTKDFWQNSAWLDQWVPHQLFVDNTPGNNTRRAIRRGHYSDEESFYAKDSAGNYLTLLRGMAYEYDNGQTYLGAMVASRFGLWDQYSDFNNVPAVIRGKHFLTQNWMIGGLYTYRAGLVDGEVDALNQVFSFDSKYFLDKGTFLYGQVATSVNSLDRLSEFESDHQGQAYRTGFEWLVPHHESSTTTIRGNFSWMDTKFQPTLSNYSSLRDDEFWGNYITFTEIPHAVEPFKIGSGLDRGRYVARLNAETIAPEFRVANLFDMRHVRRTDSNSFVEHVFRDEFVYNVTPKFKTKVFGRLHYLPETESDVEPFLGSFVPAGEDDPALLYDVKLQNTDIDAGLDPSRKTFGIGGQYKPRQQWTFEGSISRTNDIPDFSRGLQNDVFVNNSIRDPENPNLWLDRIQPFLYGQSHYSLPDYDYFSIFKERIIYRPDPRLQFVFHAAQNSYELWAPIDENVNHQGLSMDYQINNRWSVFADYSHSMVVDVPRFIDTGFTEYNYDSHHNVYGVLKYRVNSQTFLLMEYGVFGKTFYEGSEALPVSPFAVTTFSLPTIDTEHLFRLSLEGEF